MAVAQDTGLVMEPSRLRVGFDGASLSAEAAGVRRYATELVRALAAAGEVELTLFGDVRQPGVLPHLPAVPVPRRLPTNLGRSLFDLPLALRSACLDVFHAPAYTAPLWGNTPVVLTIHDVSYARHPEWYPYRRDAVRRAFYRASARRAAAIVTDSEFSKREIVAAYGLDPATIFVAHLGATHIDERPAASGRVPALLTPGRFLLHVGDLHSRRNLLTAVRALASVRRDPGMHDIVLALVGRDLGELSRLETEAARLGAGGALVPLGNVSDSQLVSLYAGAVALLYPSRYEGFGLPLAEAMRAGLPVIAAAAGTSPEIVGSAGLLVAPDDEPGFADAISRLLGDRALVEQLGTAGRRRAQAFSWAETARRTADVYRLVAHVSRAWREG